MSNEPDHSQKHDEPPTAPKPRSAGPEFADDEREQQADHGGEDDMARRNQSIQDRSLGAPVTGMPGTPKPARRG